MTIVEFDRRPIVSIADLCIPIRELPKKMCFTLPGGLEVCVPQTRLNIGLLEYCQFGLGLANVAIAPLKPFMEVLDVILSIVDMLKAVPDLLTDPSAVVRALDKVREKMIIVAKLVPPLSVFVLATQIFDALIETLEGFAEEFDSIGRFSRRIQSAQLTAQRAPGLEELLTCARGALRQQMDNMSQLFGALNAIIEIINFISKLAHAEPLILPLFGSSESAGGTYGELPADPEAAAVAIRVIVSKLRIVRSAIPL